MKVEVNRCWFKFFVYEVWNYKFSCDLSGWNLNFVDKWSWYCYGIKNVGGRLKCDEGVGG